MPFSEFATSDVGFGSLARLEPAKLMSYLVLWWEGVCTKERMNQTCASAQALVEKIRKSIPPYCPNPECRYHDPASSALMGRYALCGTRDTKRYPYKSVNFLCYWCKKKFAHSIFTLSYRDKRDADYSQILEMRGRGSTLRDIAEGLGCSLKTVVRRKSKIARQALLIQAKFLKDIKIKESIAMDGLENFSFSQYDPNNLNHAVGRETFFCYDFNFAPMNRKGRMSGRQVVRKKQLENLYGKYPPSAVETAAEKLFRRLFNQSQRELTLHTDNHYMYRAALRRLRGEFQFFHMITPAKICRNYRNRLFAINHLDLLTRQKVASFKRETVSFAKHSIGMLEDFAIFMIQKNFMRTKFLKKHAADPLSNKESPAMRLGLVDKKLTFHELFEVRATKFQVELNDDWLAIFERRDESSRRPIARYHGI
jgi:hypothetical protein